MRQGIKFDGYTLSAMSGEDFYSPLHSQVLPNTGIKITKNKKSETFAIYHPLGCDKISNKKDVLMGFYYLLNLCVIGGMEKRHICEQYGWHPSDIKDLAKLHYILDVHGKMCSVIDEMVNSMKIKHELVYLMKKLNAEGINP